MIKTNKINVNYYLLAFIETFSIWQMGIIYYSSKTLTLNSLNFLPITLDNSMLVILIGYVLGMIFITFLPKETVLAGRIIMLFSLLSSVVLFFNIPALLFKILYYVLIFNCVFFISINTSMLINLYNLKSALMDAILGSMVIGITIPFFQNDIIPVNFATFNTVSIICLCLIAFALFKLPLKMETNFIAKNDKIKLPPKKNIIGLIFIQALCCLSTLFTASLSEGIINGVAVSYLGSFIAGLIAYILYKKKMLKPFQICKYYFGICSVGFVLFLLPISIMSYIGLLLQGFGFFNILIAPFLIANLFEVYPTKLIAPFMIIIDLLAVIINSLLIEAFRNSSTYLYLAYSIISIITIIVYLVIEQNLELQTLDKKEINKCVKQIACLSKRETEVVNLLVNGYSNKEIAGALNISNYTVNDHIKNIYRKTDTHSKVELVTSLFNDL